MYVQLNTDIGRQFQLNSSLRMTNVYRQAFNRVSRSSRRRGWIGWAVMATCITVILSVSLVDVYWSFKTQEVLIQTEQNPVGTWLIEADQGDIALFMTCKMLGNILVILALPALFLFRKSWGLLAATSLACFQLVLFAYLNAGHLLPFNS